ncbi:MAG: sulfotransferase domain-containing protein [Aquirufa sp.]
METSKNIIWLASYPKSGNTWFRSFLTALKSENEAIDINDLKTDGIFSTKEHIEHILDLESDYLLPHEVVLYQKISWNFLAEKAKRKLFVKIHDAFDYSDYHPDLSIVPEKQTFKAVYFVRHPYDVVPSLANHFVKDMDKSIDFINNTTSALADVKYKKRLEVANQFYQHLDTWNNHVKSWLERPQFPVLFIRYEDMKLHPFETFKKAIQFMEIDFSDEQIQNALEMTKFENLRKQEEEKGFREKGTKTKFFFNKGEVNYGKSLLTEEQINSINTVNEEMMKHFGYWPSKM